MNPPSEYEVRDMSSYTHCDPLIPLREGRTKLIMSTLATDYMSVHVVTTSRYKMHTPPDIILNHFKGYGKYKLVHPVAAPDWREAWETVANRSRLQPVTRLYPTGHAYVNAPLMEAG